MVPCNVWLFLRNVDLLTRILEYHVLLLLESGITYAIESAHKLKDIASSVAANTPYLPASIKMLSNICASGTCYHYLLVV